MEAREGEKVSIAGEVEVANSLTRQCFEKAGGVHFGILTRLQVAR
jgi:hypothetical protein